MDKEIVLPYWLEPLIAEAVNHRLGREARHRVTSDDITSSCLLDPGIQIKYVGEWSPGHVLQL